jgi:hypothetical protein
VEVNAFQDKMIQTTSNAQINAQFHVPKSEEKRKVRLPRSTNYLGAKSQRSNDPCQVKMRIRMLQGMTK